MWRSHAAQETVLIIMTMSSFWGVYAELRLTYGHNYSVKKIILERLLASLSITLLFLPVTVFGMLCLVSVKQTILRKRVGQ